MKELKDYLNHLPTCNKMQDWLEADQAMSDTLQMFRDAGYYEALEEIETKKNICTCGLEKMLASHQPDIDLLTDLEDYFDNRADADGSSEGYHPNKEMDYLVRIRQALNLPEANHQ